MSAQVVIALIIGILASVEDLWRRSVSNWICLAALVAGFGWQISQQGFRGAVTALLGALAGFAVFLIFYLLGGMGGGDIKLMTGFGALLGANRLWEAALWTAILGAVLAAVVLGVHGVRKLAGGSPARPAAIPYAPAIALGVWISLVLR
ncbi:MAG: prepilin peptidase [Acidobacteria bacterium]|nr:prepilin peptidase [Acidobacteriota bacterium]